MNTATIPTPGPTHTATVAGHTEMDAAICGMIARVAEWIGFDAWHHRVDPILADHVPGFIPHTDGGWEALATFGLHGPVTDAVAALDGLRAHDRDHAESIFRDHHVTDADAERYPDVTDHPEWDGFYEGWATDDVESCWFVKVRAAYYRADNRRNITGVDEVWILLGINDDLGAGRDSIRWAPGVGTTWVYEQVVPFDLVTTDLLATVETELGAAWDAA